MEQDSVENKGGSLDKALKGEIKLPLDQLLKEAWQLTKNGKTEVLQGVLLLLVAAFVLAFLMQAVFNIDSIESASPNALILIKFIGVAITAPILAVMSLLGVAHSVGQRPAFFQLFKRLIGVFRVVVLALALATFSDVISVFLAAVIGMASMIFVIYVSMATGFSVLLLIEKQLSLVTAITQSVQVFNRYILPLSCFYLGFTILFVLGVFTFGVAYIWLIPLYFNMKGVLYRELFGIRVVASTSDNSSSDSVFHV